MSASTPTRLLVRTAYWLAMATLAALAGSAASTAFGAIMALDARVDDATQLYRPASASHSHDDDESDGGGEARPKANASLGRVRGLERAQTIVDNNLFCPTCAPTTKTVEAGPTVTQLPLILVATMEAEDPRDSLATILDEESEVVAPYEAGAWVRKGVRLAGVGRGQVRLQTRQGVELLLLPKPVAEKKRKRKKNKKKRKKNKKKNKREIPGARDAIDCAKHHCTVDRQFVDRLIKNPSLLAKQARAVPAIRDGETEGFKFYGIRKGSLPRLLGIKNGDLVMAVNGMDLDSMDQAMGIYTKLRRADHLSVRVRRKGKIVTKEIDIE